MPETSMWARALCVLNGGHDFFTRFEPGRVYSECNSCGHCTPGWEVESAHSTADRSDDTGGSVDVPRQLDPLVE